jgi:3-oxoacyl-[acyl-carrier-protein] synthase III
MGGQRLDVNARRDMTTSSEIVATGYSRPELLVDNDGFFARCHFPIASDRHGRQALEDTTRMRTRRWCGPDEDTFTMALAAVRMALADDPTLLDELDVVIAVSATTVPGFAPPEKDHAGMADLAPLLMRAIGRNDALGFDVKAVNCAGFLRGLQILDGMLADPNHRAGLVVATERCSGLAIGAQNRSPFCFILGDAAGAAIVRRRARKDGIGLGLIDHLGGMDTALYHDMTILPDRDALYVRGSTVGPATVQMLIATGRRLLERNGLTIDDVDWLLPMQTHAGMVEQVRAGLGCPAEKLIWRGDVTGFSGSASIPATLAEQIENEVLGKGDLVLSLAVGAGLSFAGTLYRLST